MNSRSQGIFSFFQGDSVYVASDNNTVDKYALSDGSHSGVLFRFSSNPTHVAVSESQNLIAAGSR